MNVSYMVRVYGKGVAPPELRLESRFQLCVLSDGLKSIEELSAEHIVEQPRF
jgi:hypothetical protein